MTKCPKSQKTQYCGTLLLTALAQHGKPDQTDAFSYYEGVGSTQQILTPGLMVSCSLPLHINLSNNGTNRSFDYGQTLVEAISQPEIVSWPLPIYINLSNNGTNRSFDYGQTLPKAISLPEIVNAVSSFSYLI